MLKMSTLTDTVQSVHGDRLKRPPHHGILLQHLVEVVHGQRVQAAVRVGSDAGRPPAARQQTNLCKTRDGNVRELISISICPFPLGRY